MSRRFSSSVQENLRRGEGDLSDLISINIQRGRERGVPGYTKYRNLQLCGLSNVKSFDDLKNVADFDQDDVENLRKVYDNVHDIDLFVGGKQSPSACVCVCVCMRGGGGGWTVARARTGVRRNIPRISLDSLLPEVSHCMEIYDRKERDLSSLLLGSVSSLVCLLARGTLHLTAKFLVHDVMMFVYYYMKNFCNLIGLEQWYFTLI